MAVFGRPAGVESDDGVAKVPVFLEVHAHFCTTESISCTVDLGRCLGERILRRRYPLIATQKKGDAEQKSHVKSGKRG